MAVFISRSAEDTLNFAKEYAATLNKGDVVLLNGDMGAGKTVFAKGVALGLGIEDEVTSPTYAYMNDYYGKLYHYDCYRLKSGAQAEGLGLTDYFYGDGVCLIEWSENIADVLPEKTRTVSIKEIDENTREIDY
ncbi:MAG TPA: tRNA (adenosine(37)-N6)-threonylcarbamoyltransferase complex ATPase subunit type 1 TsaE [Candidatus Coproplasma excrementigallinarum]|uniref:tRNA threonylcarbamoyladenosine biosynthesis protein TsaE n=1 Tax=Candidatus Coproplasma excrementigallinarum TaxID=2840747 RepID=A0A9D1SJ41_9FIRM|nr:tRNA (adenosine(37)-N6)-threonylcarbamoyltransferase complex ATPase subunit type 1 TsaE [Candidatus Coproplasma excrementigallinarum]